MIILLTIISGFFYGLIDKITDILLYITNNKIFNYTIKYLLNIPVLYGIVLINKYLFPMFSLKTDFFVFSMLFLGGYIAFTGFIIFIRNKM